MARAAFVVPGGVGAVTGGNLYDSYVIRALEQVGWQVSVDEPGGGPVDADVVVIDSLAFSYGPPRTDVTVVALAHQLPSEANRRPEWEQAEERTLASASLVVVVAEHLREAVSRLTDAPIDVISPGRDHAWARDGATLEENVVVCVANAVPGKGVPDAITAFREAGILDGELVVVGHERDEREAEAIRRAAGSDPSVRFAGLVGRESLAELYAGACLFLTASTYEGWPIAVSEAMASGLPIVGFDAPGVRDLVRSGRDGVLVPAGDVTALSEAIRHMFQDRSRAREMGASARERALGWPTWEETGDRFVRALAKLVA
ncbi:MAG: glycosyltransferase family 4 protein [Actinomycetota bacterium]|nr:glycosyltransferase family 4 protein [Actinomycetota bacterium]